MNTENLISLEIVDKRLKQLGFTDEYYGYVNYGLADIDYTYENKTITIQCYCKEETEEVTFGVKDFSNYLVSKVIIKTKEFGYPEGRYDIDYEWQGSITLSDDNTIENFISLTPQNLDKALWMFEHPIQAKIKIAKGYIKEAEEFVIKFGKILDDLGWIEYSNSLFEVGCTNVETEPYLRYIYNNTELSFKYNMFTEKLEHIKIISKNPIKYQVVNVNDLSKEDFRKEVIEFMKSLYL